MEADALLAVALTAIPRAQLAALIDLPSGMFCAVQPEPADNANLDLFAATVKEMYDGEFAEGLRAPLFTGADPGSGGHRVNVFLVSGEHVQYVMARMHTQPHLVLAIVCPASSNIGMSLVRARHLAQTHQIEGV
jgi:hypothetical protein